MMNPNYRLIFSDIINKKIPDRKKEFQTILSKRNLSFIDIINLNERIFRNEKIKEKDNQKHRSYGKSDILQILDYQKKHRLNNSQLANHFRLSRNTIAKWKRTFLI